MSLVDRDHYFETRTDLVGRRKDGSQFDIEIQLSPMEINGAPVTILSIRDVTERRLEEATRARLAAIVQSSSTAISLLDLTGTIRSWNRGAEKLLGYSAEEAIGQHVSMLYPSERPNEFRINLERLGRDEPVEDFETVRLHKDGTRLDVALTMSLVTDDGGRATGLCAIYTDIRPRKGMEAVMADLLEKERQRVGRELHDTLGQQLTAVGMMVSSLKAQIRDTEQGKVVSRIEQTVADSKGQLRSLIAGVFPVAVDPERLPWALRDLAHETTRLYGLSCRLEAGEVDPVEDAFVATQLFLIAREAVHNAVHHAQAREIVVRLESEGGTRLTVTDDGKGMPDTVDETVSMGLRIMRYRSGLIGGCLTVESHPGSGTKLIVTHWPSRKP